MNEELYSSKNQLWVLCYICCVFSFKETCVRVCWSQKCQRTFKKAQINTNECSSLLPIPGKVLARDVFGYRQHLYIHNSPLNHLMENNTSFWATQMSSPILRLTRRYYSLHTDLQLKVRHHSDLWLIFASYYLLPIDELKMINLATYCSL
jgi:hypothetical protein